MSPLSNKTVFRVHWALDKFNACEIEQPSSDPWRLRQDKGRHEGRSEGQSSGKKLSQAPRIVRKQAFTLPLPEEPMEAMQALQAWMGASASPRSQQSQEWVLGLAHVRYVLIPWNPELVDEALLGRMAAALLEQQFNEDAQLYAVQISQAIYGKARLASFVPHVLLNAITAYAALSMIPVTRILPSLAAVWDRFYTSLHPEQGQLCLVEGHRQLTARYVQGDWMNLKLRPFDAANAKVKVLTGGQGGETPTQDEDPQSLKTYVFGDEGMSVTQGQRLLLNLAEGFAPEADSSFSVALCGVV